MLAACSLFYKTELAFLSLVTFLIANSWCTHYTYNVYCVKACIKQIEALKIMLESKLLPREYYSSLQRLTNFCFFDQEADPQSQVLQLRNTSSEDACAILMLPLLHAYAAMMSVFQ